MDWDFFVSYTSSDQPWAEWAAWTLEEARYRVLVQAWDFVPGSNWVAGMQNGVQHAARTIAVLSDDYAHSLYGKAEWQAAWAADPTGAARRLLVVRVADCARPGLLGQVVSIDVFDRSQDQARMDLLRVAESAASGARAKPDIAPPFPPDTRAVSVQPAFPLSGSAGQSTWPAPTTGGGIQVGNVSAPGGQAVGINHGQVIQHRDRRRR